MTQQELEAQQDQLRSMRQFISLASGVMGSDQTLAGTDYAAVNSPGGFTSVGPYGASIEGQPIVTYSPTNGVTVAPLLLLAGLGIAAYLLMR